LLGRWWQAVLYNPGGFGDEFRRIRLGKALSLIALVLVGVSSMVEGQLLYQDLMVVALVPFTVQGLAVIHAVIKRRKVHVGWLAGVYILLLIATGQMVLLLSFAGAVDNWIDFRGLVGPDTGQDDR
jgi:uncharacterized protein YybS (DUF2232 family)